MEILRLLTPLICMRRLTQEKVQSQGRPLAAAVATLKEHLPSSAILVGQGIGQDVAWLGLVEGQDFEVVSLSLYPAWNAPAPVNFILQRHALSSWPPGPPGPAASAVGQKT